MTAISLRRLLACALILAAAAWVGGNVTLVLGTGHLFPPLKEALGEDAGRSLAGKIFGGWLGRWSLVAWGLCGVVLLLGIILSAFAWGWGRRITPVLVGLLLLALLGARLGSHLMIASVDDLRSEIVAAREDGDDEALEQARAEHARVHATATRLFAGETLIAALLALVHSFALARRGGPCDG